MDVEHSTSILEITESVLLDTGNLPSLLAVTVQATGGSADELRRQLESLGRQEFEQERLQYFARRYAAAKRVGKVQYRDQRKTNELAIAELFEIRGFLKQQTAPRTCAFHLPDTFVLDALRVPVGGLDMQSPLRLPFPQNFIHTFEVQATSLQPMAVPRLVLDSDYLRFSRRQKSRHKFWSMTLDVSTLGAKIPPHHIAEHENLVAQIAQESVWSLSLPTGLSHPRRTSDFGQLPPVRHPDPPVVASVSGEERPRANRPRPPIDLQQTLAGHRTERRRVRSMQTKYMVGLVIAFLFLLIIGYILYFLVGIQQL